ncbi:MAG: tripartite tricarboxylate transporter TctB family protein [Thermohalobaculum sp.]|nr:tripartite tricarboxylate transporter TctB family protein [Thermohalobaculum sp.]
MRFNDAIIGCIVILFAAVAGYATREFPTIPGQAYGAALFPRLLCAGFAVCGLVLISSGLRGRAGGGAWVALDPWARSTAGLLTIALTLGGMLFYILASEWLGFIPTAFLMVSALMLRLRGGWGSSLVIAAAVTLAVHQIFYGLLLVPLPWGVLEPLVF